MDASLDLFENIAREKAHVASWRDLAESREESSQRAPPFFVDGGSVN